MMSVIQLKRTHRRVCDLCLRPVVLYASEIYCPRCVEVIKHPEGRWEDVEYLTRALMRHIRRSLGYWPPRWYREIAQRAEGEMAETKIRLEVELSYDAEMMHGNYPEGRDWFFGHILGIAADDGDLVLHSNEIGDSIGTIAILRHLP